MPPAGVNVAPVTVTSANRPYALDANGDGKEDVLWYAPGASADLLWLGQGPGTFSASPLSIVGTYDDVLPGDVDGDGDDDVVVYNRTSGAAYLMRSRGDGTFSLSVVARSARAGGRSCSTATATATRSCSGTASGSMPDAIWNWVGGRVLEVGPGRPRHLHALRR